MSEKRGSRLLKIVDQYIGGILLLVLMLALVIKKMIHQVFVPNPLTKDPKSVPDTQNSDRYLVVCFGAIGDLILLTQAAQIQLRGKKVFLACTKSNQACAELYQDFYAGIEVANIRSLTSLLNICTKHSIQVIFDSTQWANIGPIQTGIARLFNKNIQAIGFQTASLLRNSVYTCTVKHSSNLHEVGNFLNLLASKSVILSNADIGLLAPTLYEKSSLKKTKKVLFHLWPSGTRSYLKEWPIAYWVQLAQYLSDKGYEIYLSGSPTDRERNMQLIAQSQIPLINIAGSLDLLELKDFISHDVEFAVCVNTGILHLAASQGVPVIGLHGPTNPNRWGPLGFHSIALLPKKGSFAYLNYGFEYPKNDKDAYALDQLDVAQVIEAIERLTHTNSVDSPRPETN